MKRKIQFLSKIPDKTALTYVGECKIEKMKRKIQFLSKIPDKTALTYVDECKIEKNEKKNSISQQNPR